MSPQDPPPDDGDPTRGDLPGPAEETAEERAWREIVANYGERADVRDEPARPEGRFDPAQDETEDEYEYGDRLDDEPAPVRPDPEDRFVPPPPPPLPRPTGLRAVAWAGIYLAPLMVLVAVVTGLDLPTVLDLAFVSWFVGGFVYLVATMRRSPPDPWDDGSRV